MLLHNAIFSRNKHLRNVVPTTFKFKNGVSNKGVSTYGFTPDMVSSKVVSTNIVSSNMILANGVSTNKKIHSNFEQILEV